MGTGGEVILGGVALVAGAVPGRADESKEGDAQLVATSVMRVRVEAKGDRAVVEHDVALVRDPRAAGSGTVDATLHVAFGAPGVLWLPATFSFTG